MYRRCYRYEDMIPAAAVRAQQVTPFSVPAEQRPADPAPLPVDVTVPEPITAPVPDAEPIPDMNEPAQKEAAGCEEEAAEQPLSFTQGMASSIKGIYENVRSQLIRDGKVLGILETDDLIILLLIVILIAEDCDDYVLLLGLAALIFLK